MMEFYILPVTPFVRFLSRQRAYKLYKPARQHFASNRIYVGKIDKEWQADLADMVGLKRKYDGNIFWP